MGCDGCELWDKNRKSCYAGKLHERFGGSNPGFAPMFEQVTLFPGRMAEATLACVYSVDCYVRTPEEIVAALFREAGPTWPALQWDRAVLRSVIVVATSLSTIRSIRANTSGTP